MEVVKNELFKDYLIIVANNGDIYIFDLPFLKFGKKIASK